MSTLSEAGGGRAAPSGSFELASPATTWRWRLHWLGRKISALLVFLALGGLLFWGHHTGWSLPKFSSLAGHTGHAGHAGHDGCEGGCEEEGWCGDHNMPETECVECNTDLLPKPKCLGWCKAHGVHDCPFCHPEVAQIKGQPPMILAALAARTRQPGADAQPENDSKCMLHERRIQFATPEAVEKAGIEVQTVETAAVAESVIGNGEVGYDQTRLARLSARVPGTVFHVYKQAGDAVKAGDVIALVDAAEVGRAKAEILHALVDFRLKTKNLDAVASLRRYGDIPQAKVQQVEAELSEARIRLTAARQALTNLGIPLQLESLETLSDVQLAERLRFHGLPKAVVNSLDAKASENLLPLTSPLDGVVVSRDVVAGEVVDTAKTLFVVADTSTMWLKLDLRVEDAGRVALGQQVQFLPDGDRQAQGRVTWISTEADPKTRTVAVRASLDNGDGRLRANVFGAGKVIVHEEGRTVVVPNSAVQWEGCCHVVFVRDKDFLAEGVPKVFHVRSVRLGTVDDRQTEILAGLLPGEVVATAGSSLLRAELLKGNLGEGCACCKK